MSEIKTPLTYQDAQHIAKRAHGYSWALHDCETCERVTKALMDVDVASREQSGAKALLAALRVMLAKYRSLVMSGDCGFWNPDAETEVVVAQAAILSADPGSEPIADVEARAAK